MGRLLGLVSELSCNSQHPGVNGDHQLPGPVDSESYDSKSQWTPSAGFKEREHVLSRCVTSPPRH